MTYLLFFVSVLCVRCGWIVCRVVYVEVAYRVLVRAYLAVPGGGDGGDDPEQNIQLPIFPCLNYLAIIR